jgi:hypothetical protein
VVEQGTGHAVQDPWNVRWPARPEPKIARTPTASSDIVSAWFVALHQTNLDRVMYVAGNDGNGDLDKYAGRATAHSSAARIRR